MTLRPGFMVVHANQAEQLRDLVVAFIDRQPLDIFETETILVQSNGIAQWLRLALAADRRDDGELGGGLGQASLLSLQMPGRFMWQLYRAILTDTAIESYSLFDKNYLRWRLLRLLPTLVVQAEFAVLADYLQADNDPADDGHPRAATEPSRQRSPADVAQPTAKEEPKHGVPLVPERPIHRPLGLEKCWQLACQLADLYDQYQVYRADWLDAWQQGQDVFIDKMGQVLPLAADQCWQAALWRYLVADMPVDAATQSRAMVHQDFLLAARRYDMTHRPALLPRRIILFGMSTLPHQTLEALAAIAPYTQILLTVLNPCQHYWADIVSDRDRYRASRQRHTAKPVPPAANAASNPLALGGSHAGHPLLAAWGKQGRDYLRLLDLFDETHAHRALFEGGRVDLFSAVPGEHLLARLQNDLLELRSVSESRSAWAPLGPADLHSLQFMTAHSALREVEVLHDMLLAEFSADPSLEPRQVMVMVPDIHQYSAAIHAVFGRLNPDDHRYIPYTISDQQADQQDPILLALQWLLQLRQQRFHASSVLSLLQHQAVAQRFGIGEADIPLIQQWVDAAAIRFSLHEAQQQSLGLPPGFANNSWFDGLHRLLLGYAMGHTDLGMDGEGHASVMPWHGVQPLAGIGGLSATLIGQLAEFVQTLAHYWHEFAMERTLTAWQPLLLNMLDACFDWQSPAQMVTKSELVQALAAVIEQAQRSDCDQPVSLSVLAEAWLEPFRQTGLQQRFMAGAVNFATLMPMRAIPFELIYLLGMNDGAFPRIQRRLDFDLMQRDQRAGDRARRDDDRYLLLEALLSARRKLVISYHGASQHDNTERTPSVLVAQLRDHVQQAYPMMDKDADLLSAITIHHPLQPFSVRYRQGLPGLFSYQHEWQALHHVVSDAVTDVVNHSTMLAGSGSSQVRLPSEALSLDIAGLETVLRDPLRFFYQKRLGLDLRVQLHVVADDEDFNADALGQWQLQQQLQQAILSRIWPQLLQSSAPTNVDTSNIITLGGGALEQAAIRMAASGLWPAAAAGHILLHDAMQSQQQWLTLFSAQLMAYSLSGGRMLATPRRWSFQYGHISLSDVIRWAWLPNDPHKAPIVLHCCATPLQGGQAEKPLRWKTLLPAWLMLLCTAASDQPMAVHVIAPDRTVELPALGKAQAVTLLQQLCDGIDSAYSSPCWVLADLSWQLLALPVEKHEKTIRQWLDGDDYRPGALARHVYLQREVADSSDYLARSQYLYWSEIFYGHFYRYLQQQGVIDVDAAKEISHG